MLQSGLSAQLVSFTLSKVSEESHCLTLINLSPSPLFYLLLPGDQVFISLCSCALNLEKIKLLQYPEAQSFSNFLYLAFFNCKYFPFEAR